MIWEWDELSTRNYDFAPMPVKYSILSSGQVLMNMKLSGLCVCTANQIIPFEFSRGIRGRGRNRDTPQRGRKLYLSFSYCLLLQVEIEIPRRGDENFFSFNTTMHRHRQKQRYPVEGTKTLVQSLPQIHTFQVEIEIPRRGDENCSCYFYTFNSFVEIEIPRRGDENAIPFCLNFFSAKQKQRYPVEGTKTAVRLALWFIVDCRNRDTPQRGRKRFESWNNCIFHKCRNRDTPKRGRKPFRVVPILPLFLLQKQRYPEEGTKTARCKPEAFKTLQKQRYPEEGTKTVLPNHYTRNFSVEIEIPRRGDENMCVKYV